ncbi:MAG: DMT family transporter [Candidatus Eisenbacteria bacterium]|uniref:DMT family transporter n=1 Tax=Eiseniibacteriota bacterium TaxID=2212470 RepID=A0A933SDY0_UNCEI|nr:DMT family transporter [Candidatus Eisenbacteria bacterium]
MREKRSSIRPPIPPIPAILGAIVSVQGGAALAKGLFPVLGAMGTCGLRVGFSAVILVAAFRPWRRRTTAEQWRALVLYGLVLGMMNLVFYLSLSRIPLGLAVTLEFVGPLGLAVAGSRRAVDLAWVLLAAAGIALITPWAGGGVDPLGVLLALGAGACWAAYIVLGGRVSRMVPGGDAVAIGMVFASFVALPAAVATGGFLRLTPALAAAGIGVALLSSAIPYTLEMVALKALPARTFGILMSLEPAVAAIAGWLFLHERLSPSQCLAVALVIAASTGATLTTSRPTPGGDGEASEGWQGG